MFSLQKLLGKEDLFFSLFEKAILEAEHCVTEVRRMLDEPDNPNHLEAVHIARQKNKDTCEQISSLLLSTFVTALEREDIEAIANALYRIPKPVEKFAQRVKMAKEYLPESDFRPQLDLIFRAVKIVSEMISELRSLGGHADVRSLYSRLQEVEGEADRLELDLLERLYSNRTNALRVLIVKDLYDLLETVVDRCRDAGNLITHVVLKNA